MWIRSRGYFRVYVRCHLKEKESLCVRTKITSSGKVIMKLKGFKDIVEWKHGFRVCDCLFDFHKPRRSKADFGVVRRWGSKCHFGGICNSPTCLPVIQINSPSLFLSALIHKPQPCGCQVCWLAKGHDSARIWSWICCSHHKLWWETFYWWQ